MSKRFPDWQPIEDYPWSEDLTDGPEVLLSFKRKEQMILGRGVVKNTSGAFHKEFVDKHGLVWLPDCYHEVPMTPIQIRMAPRDAGTPTCIITREEASHVLLMADVHGDKRKKILDSFFGPLPVDRELAR